MVSVTICSLESPSTVGYSGVNSCGEKASDITEMARNAVVEPSIYLS